MPPVNDPQMTGQAYYRSLDALADTPEFREFMHREFPAGASELLEGDRRHFLKMMGASMALAGLTMSGCRRWPREEIRPFAARPAERVPGIPLHYATSMELAGVASGLLVTTNDGRPTKIEGNPEHPINGTSADISLSERPHLSEKQLRQRLRGTTTVYEQASILNLYDPHRSLSVRRKGGEAATWDAFAAFAKEHFAQMRGSASKGLRILCEATSSPSMQMMRNRIGNIFPDAAWHEYEALCNDNAYWGSQTAFGASYRPHYKLDRANVILSLGDDFLGDHPAVLKNARQFAKSREPRGTIDNKYASRLYVVESRVSLTGANADYRLAVRPSDMTLVAAWIASRVLNDASLMEFSDQQVAAGRINAAHVPVLEQLVENLRELPDATIVMAGPSQPAEVHVLAHLMNAALRNIGYTVEYTKDSEATAHLASLQNLVQDMQAGSVDTLIIIGGNPVYDAPVDFGFAEALANVSTTINLSDYYDETAQACTWHVNRAHYLECWGDGRAYDGTIALQQPMLLPLFDGRSAIELLALITGDELTSGYDIVRRTFAEMTGVSEMERLWREALHDGVLTGSAYSMQHPKTRREALSSITDRITQAAASPQAMDIVFHGDNAVYDGRFVYNGWLQELPDPISKLTWDNAALISPTCARLKSLENGDMVTVSVNGRSLEIPVLVLPGVDDETISLPLGYGRVTDNPIAHGAGFDTYTLRSSDVMYHARGASITRSTGSYILGLTQDHHAIDTIGGKGVEERLPTIFREATLHEYEQNPDFAKHRTHVVHRLSLWEESHPFHHDGQEAKYAWGMSVDLNKCTGCSACVVACQAENNIPIVGKQMVLKSREMHWLRIDRYFKFAENADGVKDGEKVDGYAMMPMMCVHCENAPCEQVCPVAATVHDTDGLNVMVYNRCVGTRYCSNNCPYKVRRFNYFDYHRREPKRESGLLFTDLEYYTEKQASPGEIKALQFNPEVTVRMRGVMEKCTYCVQRIANAKIKAKNEWTQQVDAGEKPDRRVTVEDGLIVPACAQACPTEAIVFGDLNDSTSRVGRLQRDARSYGLLEELNTKPRTKYLAKLRNVVDHQDYSHDSHGGHNEHGGDEENHDSHEHTAPADEKAVSHG